MTTTSVGAATAPAPEDRYPAELVARFRQEGSWRDESLAQWVEHWASVKAAAVVVTDGEASLTWADLHGQSARLAGRLTELGVQPGDRVQVQLPNWAEFAQGAARAVAVTPTHRSRRVW